MDRSNWSTRVVRLGEPVPRSEVRYLSPAERLSMMWPLTVECWGFSRGIGPQSRLLRHVVSVDRRKCGLRLTVI